MKRLTDKDRDLISVLHFDGGKGPKEIAQFVDCSEGCIQQQLGMERLIRKEDIRGASDFCKRLNMGTAAFEWATKKYGIKAPLEKEPEENAEAECKQIDKDQMARIMYVLGKIDEHITSLEERLDFERKERNANCDSIYKLLTDFRNSVIMEMRKRK